MDKEGRKGEVDILRTYLMPSLIFLTVLFSRSPNGGNEAQKGRGFYLRAHRWKMVVLGCEIVCVTPNPVFSKLYQATFTGLEYGIWLPSVAL